MDCYFLFVGGSGAKCAQVFLEAALLRAGAPEHASADRIFIRLIDPDTGTETQKKIHQLATAYDRARQLLGKEAYPTEIHFDREVSSPFADFGDRTSTLPGYLGCARGSASYDLLRILVTEQQMEKDLRNGLYGWPGVGSAVWHRWFAGGKALPAKKEIEESLNAGHTVRVVLVGSIFGGTGSSGLPKLGELYQRTFTQPKCTVHGVVLTPYFMPPKQLDGQLIDGKHNPIRARQVMGAMGSGQGKYDSVHFLGLPEPVTFENYQPDRQSNPTTIVERVVAWTLWTRHAREQEKLEANYVLGVDTAQGFTFSDLHGAGGEAFDRTLERHAMLMAFLAFEYGHHWADSGDTVHTAMLAEVLTAYRAALAAWLEDETFPKYPSPLKSRETLRTLEQRWLVPAGEPDPDWPQFLATLDPQRRQRWDLFRKAHPGLVFHDGLEQAYAAMTKAMV